MKGKVHPKTPPYDRLVFDLYVKKGKAITTTDNNAIDKIWEILVLNFRHECKKRGLDLKLDVWITK